ncbi:MAG: phage head-tail adapter protein [Chloroflexi bacterium]|nr:phage head-tail adapter protein [Chloroflexota bacterium]
MSETLVQRVRRRWANLKSERSGWWPVWYDIQRFVVPDMGRFKDPSRTDTGARNDSLILDNSATRALRTLAAGWVSGTSSPAQPWFELRAGPEPLRDNPAVKAWLAQVRDILRDVFSKSNTYRVLHTMREEMAAFGTAAAVVAEDFENVIHLHPVTAGTYAVATDARGVVNTFYREFPMTVEQMVGEFGLDAVSDHVRDLYKNGQMDQQFTVIHAVEPRPVTERKRPGALGMPFREVYFEEGRDTAAPLRESGYRRFRVLVPRWIVNGENCYGTSPAREALGDIKQLQQMQLRKSQAVDYQTKPPLQGPARLKGNNSDLLPGGYATVDAANPQAGIRSVFEVRLDLQHLVGDIQDIRQRISRTFYEDVFRMISDLDKSGITARQIAEQHSEKMMLLGPVIERDQNELLAPLVEMAFEIASEAGILPEAPEEMQGAPLTVEFVSILAQAQKQAGASAVDRLLATVGTLAPIWPEAVDKVDADKVVEEYAQMLGTNPKLLRDEDVLAAIRQSRAQQQQAAAQAEQQAQQASIAKDMAAAQKAAPGGGQTNTAQQLDIARLLGG